ncbi:lysine-specific demethylase REF6-like isoform X2 [Hibiscus syriacus]|nr:lysine-specific demethylase REF6-like isoform X2 [Hibiscus syriacus]
MSPEVFVQAGIPCCRLVQNAGEFVVTFPRAYHSGFSHGFNFGEAANIATPEWLRVATYAAIRRASINYPPMVSHFQLLYDLALELCSRISMSISAKPKSSRLKDKKKTEGENLVKELFVQDLIQNNKLLHILGKGSAVVPLPKSSSDISLCSDSRVASQLRINPRMSLGLCNYKEIVKSSKDVGSNANTLGWKEEINGIKGFYSVKGKLESIYEGYRDSSFSGNDYSYRLPSKTLNTVMEKDGAIQDDALPDQRLFSCVTCGILCFACVAVLQPTDQAIRYLMSADCSFFNDWTVGSKVNHDGFDAAHADAITSEQNPCTNKMNKRAPNSFYDVSVQSVDSKYRVGDWRNQGMEDTVKQGETSALGLLASTYGDSSDSEIDHAEPNFTIFRDATKINSANVSPESKIQRNDSALSPDANKSRNPSLPTADSEEEAPLHVGHCFSKFGSGRVDIMNQSTQTFDPSVEFKTDKFISRRSNGLEDKFRDQSTASHANPSPSPATHSAEKMRFRKAVPMENADIPFVRRSDEDSPQMHVFCLEHAVEVEQQLRQIGGVHVFLLCHPEYPKIEAEAKLVAKELGIDHLWNDILYADATKNDEEQIQSALDSEDAIPGNGDWAVKLGINLFYSANLSRSTLYSKQMPYNCVIYSVFGRNSPATSPTKLNVYGRRTSRTRKVVAGKWCGKVWMSNQVHPFLAQKDPEELEQEQNFHAWATSDENVERKPENVRKAETAKVVNRKGKKRAEIAANKKVKCFELQGAVSDDSLDAGSLRQQRVIFRGKNRRLVEKEEAISCDLLEDDSLLQHWNPSRIKAANFIERDDAESEDEKEDSTHQHQQCNLRGKHCNSIEEDEVSGDSLVESSLKQRKRVPRSWLAKFSDGETVVYNDEQEEISHLQRRRIPRGKQMKSAKRNATVSKIMRKDKQRKLLESDDAMSDEDSDGDSQNLLRGILRGKQMKCMERDDEFSDDSVENSPKQKHRRVLSSKAAKFSDRRVRRNQLTEFIEREDAVSSDSTDNSPLRQPRRTPRSNQTKILEMEDAVSDDSLYGTSHQSKKSLRSGKRKAPTPRKVKQETSRNVKRAKGLSTKQVVSQQVKQETPRTWNTRIKRSARQCNSSDEDETEGGPNTRLRKRNRKPLREPGTKPKEKQSSKKKLKNALNSKNEAGHNAAKVRNEEAEYQCDIEGCSMSFGSKQAMLMHKRNNCPVKGCGKKFFSHKYLVQHRRVHLDDRPLKCPWKGCKMSFKWAWARTEHIRVHTGARPYLCAEEGCGQTFRFVSDFSRHKRKTGHVGKKGRQ